MFARKFLSLPVWERRLLVNSAVLMMGIKIGLRVVPFQTLNAWVDKISRPNSGARPTRQELLRVLNAVEMSARWTPLEPTCLVRALTGHVLLARKGFPVELCIGVARGENKAFEAHAWVICYGEVVIGNRPDLSRYKVLPGVLEKL